MTPDDAQNPDDAPEADSQQPDETAAQRGADALEDDGQGNDAETFPRSYVEQLRAENQRYRERGKRAEELGRRLHTELVRATGRLADPDDLPFDEAHLADLDTLTAAIDDLLARKPHMAARRPTGDIGQGAAPSHAPVDLAGILRARAG